FDATFCANQPSFEGRPRLVPSGTFLPDESPYGVRDVAGNVRDICSNPFLKVPPPEGRVDLRSPVEGRYRMLRGGAFSSMPLYARVATRLVVAPDARAFILGFRLARMLRA
ncbi:MAG: SUMF1/EgtB/PvdO family nonheme iron enzyme, partial [Myxococcota bacterium]